MLYPFSRLRKHNDYKTQNNIYTKQEAHGPHRSPAKTVQINKHILLYHRVD